LIRALEPLKGLESMRKLRPVDSDIELANGPGKLTKSLGIDIKLNKIDMTKAGPLFIRDSSAEGFQASRSARVGIREGADRLWRFYVSGNLYVSRKSSVKRA
jgi:DNA-3-methyladenine glycosylase